MVPYTRSPVERFADDEFLYNIQHTGTVSGYKRRFLQLAGIIGFLPEEYVIACFVKGLRDPIRAAVQRDRPCTLQFAMQFASWSEFCYDYEVEWQVDEPIAENIKTAIISPSHLTTFPCSIPSVPTAICSPSVLDGKPISVPDMRKETMLILTITTDEDEFEMMTHDIGVVILDELVTSNQPPAEVIAKETVIVIGSTAPPSPHDALTVADKSPTTLLLQLPVLVLESLDELPMPMAEIVTVEGELKIVNSNLGVIIVYGEHGLLLFLIRLLHSYIPIDRLRQVWDPGELTSHAHFCCCVLLFCVGFDDMLVKDVISWTLLIITYAQSGEMDSSAGLFDGFPVKDMVVWTTMVIGFAQNVRLKEALEFFERMQHAGVETDEVTLGGVIFACTQIGVSKYANWVGDVAEKSGLGPTDTVVIGSALIDMYSKCGCVEDAYKVFARMTKRKVYSYSSMISGFAMHGCAREAMELFHEMVKTETKPNRVTFVGVLTTCSHAGMVELGKNLFATMEKSYGVTPSVDHYTCMVDLLGRAGSMEEALELVRNMPMDPNASVWGALLGACRIYGNPDIDEVAANHLFKLKPDGIGNYIFLSNIYVSAGRWDNVSKVRKEMRGKGLKKVPGYSSFEGKKGVIHEFLAGDMIHPKSREIKQALEDLVYRLNFHGYQPHLSSVPYDVSEEDQIPAAVVEINKIIGFKVLSDCLGLRAWFFIALEDYGAALRDVPTLVWDPGGFPFIWTFAAHMANGRWNYLCK